MMGNQEIEDDHEKSNKNSGGTGEGYRFQHIGDDPRTLTMTQMPTDLFQKIYEPATYIWLSKDPQPHQISQKLDLQLIPCQNINEVLEKIEHSKFTVIVAADTFCEEVETKLCVKSCVNKIICYPIQRDFYYKLRGEDRLGEKFVMGTSDLGEVIQYIDHYKEEFKAIRYFDNFISLKFEVWDSDTLMKTMSVMLKQETNRQMLIDELANVAKKFMHQNQQEIENFIKDATCPMTPQKAIKWYTSETFLYKVLNSLLKAGRHPTETFCLQPYFKDLFIAIKQLHEIQSKDQPYKEFTCYRGGIITEKQVQKLKKNLNGVVKNLGFMSTSTNNNISSKLIVNAQFIIYVKDEKRHPKYDHGYAFIKKYSSFVSEEEILFNPLNSFKVKSIQKIIDKNKEYHRIELVYGELARIMGMQQGQLTDEDLEIKDLTHFQSDEDEKMFCIGQILVQNVTNLKGSQEYWTRYNQIDKDDLSTMGLQMLAQTLINKNNFKHPFDFYQECLKRVLKKYGEGHIQYVKILNKIGLMYRYREMYDKSLEALEKCRKIISDTATQKDLQYFNVLINIGDVYQAKGMYKQGLQIFTECYTNMKQIFAEKHPIYVRIILKIGQANYRLGKYNQALNMFEKARCIRKKMLGENHPDYSTVLSLMGLVYYKLKQYECSLNLYEEVRVTRKETLGQNHSDYASILSKLGQVHTGLGNASAGS